MIATAPTLSQIKAQVTAICQKVPNAKIIGIKTKGKWIGDSDNKSNSIAIEQCDSPLAIRIAIRNHNEADKIKVIITNLEESELDRDILVRLTKRRLFPLDNWEIVKSLFQAQTIDPRLLAHSWIAEILIAEIPESGYTPVTSGFLDADIVWSILLAQIIQLKSDRPDLTAILQWSTNCEHIAKFQITTPQFREAAINWLIPTTGVAVKTILDCIFSNSFPDAVPLGLALNVIFHPDIKSKLERAIGKLEERYLGGKSPELAIVQQWSNAAMEVIRSSTIETKAKNHILERADRILAEVGAESYTYLSCVLPSGLNHRLTEFSKYLIKTTNNPTTKNLEDLVEAYNKIKEHDLAPENSENRSFERIDMAIRLAQYLVQQATVQPYQPKTLGECINHNLQQGSFLDWARLVIRSGDRIQQINESYSLLFDKITDIREKQALEFADFLQDWTEFGSHNRQVLPIETILESVVAPLAKHSPLLLIVMDGMSMAVCRELMANIEKRYDWIPLAKKEHKSSLMAGLAAIPSITEVSRTSLLCGQLQSGNQTHEKREFTSYPKLLACCNKDSPPILFHKASLRDQDNTGLAQDVRQTISSKQNKIVGVVINAVDDNLSKGEQLDIRWSVSEIKVLSTLLCEAKLSQRLIILLSDHGHIVEHQTTYQKFPGNERWRYPKGKPQKGEKLISGKRVVIPDSNSLIAPWTEKMRYCYRKNGYHGGLNPQEMIIPIAILSAKNSYPKGWEEAVIDTPSWWDKPLKQNVAKQPIATSNLTFTQSTEYSEFSPLFQLLKEQPNVMNKGEVSQWIQELLDSPIYKSQKQRMGRLAPQNNLVKELLFVLEQNDCKLSLSQLAKSVSYSVTQTTTLLDKIQRILNIDGYAIINCNTFSDIVWLNQKLLCKQFNIENI